MSRIDEFKRFDLVLIEIREADASTSLAIDAAKVLKTFTFGVDSVRS